MEVGQSAANVLYQQASGGTFRTEADAARRCAEVYTRFVGTTLEPQIKRSDNLQRLTGFGGFDSAKQLQDGFSGSTISSPGPDSKRRRRTGSTACCALHAPVPERWKSFAAYVIHIPPHLNT